MADEHNIALFSGERKAIKKMRILILFRLHVKGMFDSEVGWKLFHVFLLAGFPLRIRGYVLFWFKFKW